MPDASLDSIRHPEFLAEINEWLRAWDFYRGGRHVIAPGRKITQVGRWVVSAAASDASISGGGSPDIERGRSRRLIYERQAFAGYLASHVRESGEEYQDRVARAMHLPFFRSIVDVYVSAVLRTSPQSDTSGEPWTTYWADADLAGTTHDELMRQALTLALVQRKAFVVVDRPHFEGTRASRAEQIALGDRAYAYVLSATDLVDWRLDEFGRFIWAVIREDEPDARVPGEAPSELRNQYRTWYRDRWELTDSDGEVTTQLHPLGRVPIVPLFARRGHESRRTLASDGVLSDIVDVDCAIYNHLSLFHEQLFSQVFSQLAVPTADGEAPDLELGVQRVLGFSNEGGSQPLYLAPDPNILTAQLSSISQHISWGRQMATVGRGNAELSKEERSGAALQHEAGDKNNAVSSLVGAVERCDRGIHELVALWEGKPIESAPKRTYSRDVSLKALSAQIADATSLSKLAIPEKAMSELVIPILSRALREHGVGEAAIARAEGAIREAAEKVLDLAPAPPMATEPDEDEGNDGP